MNEQTHRFVEMSLSFFIAVLCVYANAQAIVPLDVWVYLFFPPFPLNDMYTNYTCDLSFLTYQVVG